MRDKCNDIFRLDKIIVIATKYNWITLTVYFLTNQEIISQRKQKHEVFVAEKKSKGGYAEMIFLWGRCHECMNDFWSIGFGSWFRFGVLVRVRGFGSCPHEPIMIFLLTHGWNRGLFKTFAFIRNHLNKKNPVQINEQDLYLFAFFVSPRRH